MRPPPSGEFPPSGTRLKIWSIPFFPGRLFRVSNFVIFIFSVLSIPASLMVGWLSLFLFPFFLSCPVARLSFFLFSPPSLLLLLAAFVFSPFMRREWASSIRPCARPGFLCGSTIEGVAPSSPFFFFSDGGDQGCGLFPGDLFPPGRTRPAIFFFSKARFSSESMFQAYSRYFWVSSF